MKIIDSSSEIKLWRQNIKGSVGFVPTMGALHKGHARLLDLSKKENDVTILSIFVNKTQFNDPSDYSKYPKTWDSDLELAKNAGVDVVFAPSFPQMYPDGYRFRVIENDFSKILCGQNRPGHFDGVLTVVLKLFMICKPTQAYFGEKDYQQLSLIRDMSEALFLDLKIVPVATVREEDGLAMSSRNTRLNLEQRKLAPKIYQTIVSAKSAATAEQTLSELGFQVDYVVDFKGRRFVAVKMGDVRLIDNVEI